MITTGVFLLLFLVWQLWWTDIEANAEAEDILETTRDSFSPTGSATGDIGIGERAAADEDSGLVADYIVHMPTIGEVRPVVEGIELSVLNQGVLGQYPDSEAPGEVGNFTMAGHRTTYGRPLWNIAELAPGDPIIVETVDAYFVYRFDRTQIVTPFQTEVIADVPGDPSAQASEKWMVMTACHPKFSAAQRIVAFNLLDYEQPRSDGPPPEMGG